MTISLVGQATNTASANSLAVSRSSAGGNALVAIGQLYTGGSSGAYPSTITDTAGNTWQVATALSSNPPASTPDASLNAGRAIAIAWTLGASAITSVTLTAPNAAFMSFNISEWSGIGSETAGGYVQGAPSTPNEVVSSSLAVPAGGLVIGGAYPSSGSGLTSGEFPAAATQLTAPQAGNAFWFGYQIFTSPATLAWDWLFTDAGWISVAAVFAPPGAVSSLPAQPLVVPSLAAIQAASW